MGMGESGIKSGSRIQRQRNVKKSSRRGELRENGKKIDKGPFIRVPRNQKIKNSLSRTAPSRYVYTLQYERNVPPSDSEGVSRTARSLPVFLHFAEGAKTDLAPLRIVLKTRLDPLLHSRGPPFLDFRPSRRLGIAEGLLRSKKTES